MRTENVMLFTLKDSETVIDAEFKAQPMDKEGTLITYQEEMDVTAASGE